MSLKWPYKDPDEKEDFAIDWLGTASEPGRLYGSTDTIETSTWIVPSGITEFSSSFTDTKTTIWLTSGVLGVTYQVLNRITTAGGRIFDQTVKIKIKTK